MVATGSFRTPLCDRLGITYPIFGFNHSVDVTVAICLAGGIGIYGATRQTPEEITTHLREIRARVGDRPFGVDLVLPANMPERNNREEIEQQLPTEHKEFVEHIYQKYEVGRATRPGLRSRLVRSKETARQELDAVLDSDANVFAIGVGSPPEAIARAKVSGKTIVSLCGSPKHARRALDNGADILVAQGYDAGGHTGTIGTFTLVPQIVALAGDVPVVVAGGVVTGGQIAAALAMGAQGVWCGTVWLTTSEHALEPEIVKKLLEAGPEDTVISRADSGKTLRQVRTAWSEEWAAPDAPAPLRMPYQDILVGDLLGAINEHKVVPLMHTPAGQGVAMLNEVTGVAETMHRLVRETEAALARVRSYGG
jgi:NAD(P)H-dependent flavin oxidoreductase YrpB (nitropropane dioxygenase family)